MGWKIHFQGHGRGCWLEASVADMAVGFLQSEWSRKKEIPSSQIAFYELIVALILSIRSKSPSLAPPEKGGDYERP